MLPSDLIHKQPTYKALVLLGTTNNILEKKKKKSIILFRKDLKIMKQFLDFIQNYYQIIISVITFLFTLILLIIRKKPSSSIMSDVKLALVQKLPELIVSAEVSFDKVLKAGSSKKDLVIGLGLEFVAKLLKRKLSVDEIKLFSDFISDNVEAQLLTPSKKEVL